MSEETVDLFASAVVFGLALYAFLRRQAVVDLVNEREGVETDAA